MKTLFIVAAYLIFAPAAFAADATPPADEDLSITLNDCQMLADYQPSADVDYKPGVDVNGNALAPADLTPAVVKPPQKYSFDLNVDAAQRLGLAVPPGSQGLMKVGTITIENGQATFNGKPLEGDAAAALKAACAAKAAKNPPK